MLSRKFYLSQAMFKVYYRRDFAPSVPANEVPPYGKHYE